MKVYTGTGDSGKTSLFSGERIFKSDPRIEAYGDLDEVNALTGAIAAALSGISGADAAVDHLQQIQRDLLQAGAWLATTPDSSAVRQLKDPPRAQHLEEKIDAMQAQLPPLNAFILPGGHMSSAWAHVARTVCRRAERRIVGLGDPTGAGQAPLEAIRVYVNRLSDYFFVLARFCNLLAGVEDERWQG